MQLQNDNKGLKSKKETPQKFFIIKNCDSIQYNALLQK